MHTYMGVSDLHLQIYIIRMHFQASEGPRRKRKKCLFNQNLEPGNQSMKLTNAQGCSIKNISPIIRLGLNSKLFSFTVTMKFK